MIAHRRRGIYLIAALFLSVVLIMLVGSALSLLKGTALGGTASDNDRALLAADSGLRYVQARLAENYNWRGNDNAVVVDRPDFWVREDNGNVVGLLRPAGGEWVQFRVRFNYQDDSAGNQEGLPNPAALTINSPYVSVNNILGGSPANVPRADGPNFSVLASSATPYTVPAGTACVLVEGRAGPGLRDLSPSNPNPASGVLARRIATQVVEAYLRAAAVPGADAAAMGAGDVTGKLGVGGVFEVKSKVKNGTPRVRSKGLIKVEGGDGKENYKSDDGETYASDGVLNALYDSNKVTPGTENPADGFYKLTWDDVKKAQSSDPKLLAGTYVLWDDGTLHRYNMSYADYAAHIQANPSDAGTVVGANDLPSTMSLDVSDTNKPKLQITGNVFIDGAGQATDEFNFIPRKGAQEDPPGTEEEGGTPLTDAQMVTQVLTSLSGAPVVGSAGGWTGGPKAARWTVPIGTPFGATITAGTGSWSAGTYWGIRAVDNGDGTASLMIDSGYQPLLSPDITANPQAALAAGMAMMAGNPQFSQLLSALTGSGATPTDSMKELNLGAAQANLKPDNLTVEFKPTSGKSAILSADGSVRIGSNVKGDGGSITSGGQIRIVGAGSDLNASAEEGLCLYAKGDVVLSGLKKEGATSYKYKNFHMKGVIYTWKNFRAKVGYDDPSITEWGAFSLQGALVAYGGDPAGNPGDGEGGAIDIAARESKLEFDPGYLVQIKNTPTPGPLTRTLYTVY